MAIKGVVEVNASDIQDYVESQMSNSKPPTKPPTIPKNKASKFTVNQADYIDYLMAKRDSEKRNFRWRIFWRKFGNFLLGIIKLALSIALTLFIFWCFYLLVWFMQNSLYFYRLDMSSVTP